MLRPVFLTSLALPLLVACAVACGSSAGNDASEASGASNDPTAADPAPAPAVDHGGTVVLDTLGVRSYRTSPCSSVAPYQPSDPFLFDVHGRGSAFGSGRAAIALRFDGSLAQGETIALAPSTSDLAPPGVESANAGRMSLDLFRGSDRTAFDASPMKRVSVTVERFPKKPGETIAFRIAITFASGQTFDESFATLAEQTQGSCLDAG